MNGFVVLLLNRRGAQIIKNSKLSDYSKRFVRTVYRQNSFASVIGISFKVCMAFYCFYFRYLFHSSSSDIFCRCATAYILLAEEEATTIVEAEKLFKQALKAGEGCYRRSQQLQHHGAQYEAQHSKFHWRE